MTAPPNNKWRSLRLLLPALLLLIAIGGALVLYVFERRIREAEFEASFREEQILRTARIQADVERWVQRDDLEMAQSVLADLGVMPELKAALFLDAADTVLAATQRGNIGRPLDIGSLGLDQRDAGRVRAAMHTARQTLRESSVFTGDRNGLVACFPASLPLRPGDLGVRHGGVILVGYDLRLAKAASIRHLQTNFLIYFASILLSATALGVSLHYLITRRLERLKSAMTAFAQGKAFAPAPSRLGDEISHLVNQFNEMGTTLSKTMAEIQDLYDHAPCGYHSTEASGTLARINDTELAWLGYTREELVGKVRFMDLLTPPCRERYQREFQRLKECGWARDLEFELVRKDGTLLPVTLSATAIKDAHGNFVMSRSVVLDATERKQTERTLRESEQKFRMIFDQAFQFIGVLSVDGILLQANQTALQFAGVSESAVLGQPFWATVWWAHSAALQEKVRAAVREAAEGKLVRFEASHPAAGGRIHHIDFSLKPVTDAAGRVIQLIPEGRDITERKQAEEKISQLNAELEQRVAARTRQLEEANRELVEFSYSVSHDLRTPLRSIDGFSHALLEDYAAALDADGKDYLQRVRAASQRIGQILDAMVRLLRLNRTDMHVTDVNLSELAAQVVGTLRQANPGRDVEFIIAPGCAARGDAGLLKIALENLLDNAWKFTVGRHPAKIEFGANTSPEGTVCFVRDNGCGFEMQYAGKLFRAFQSLHPNDESAGAGVGVGLAGVQRIIHRHGGRVWAESQPGHGATFHFTLPEQPREPRP